MGVPSRAVAHVHEGRAVRWYVVQTKPRKEALASIHLLASGIEVFYPRLRLPRYAGSGGVVPMFPKMPKVEIAQVEWTHSYKHFSVRQRWRSKRF